MYFLFETFKKFETLRVQNQTTFLYLCLHMSITTTNKGKGVMAHITIVLINPVSLEFTVAQSPVHSRGMMVGV